MNGNGAREENHTALNNRISAKREWNPRRASERARDGWSHCTTKQRVGRSLRARSVFVNPRHTTDSTHDKYRGTFYALSIYLSIVSIRSLKHPHLIAPLVCDCDFAHLPYPIFVFTRFVHLSRSLWCFLFHRHTSRSCAHSLLSPRSRAPLLHPPPSCECLSLVSVSLLCVPSLC